MCGRNFWLLVLISIFETIIFFTHINQIRNRWVLQSAQMMVQRVASSEISFPWQSVDKIQLFSVANYGTYSNFYWMGTYVPCIWLKCYRFWWLSHKLSPFTFTGSNHHSLFKLFSTLLHVGKGCFSFLICTNAEPCSASGRDSVDQQTSKVFSLCFGDIDH